MVLRTDSPGHSGFTLIEVVFGVGILGLAALTLLTLCSSALRYRRQGTNHLNAARMADMVIERTVSKISSDSPAGARDAFWAGDFPYPTTPYKSGTEKVGRQSFSYAIYAADVPGLGDGSTDPPNLLRRIDAYVWWESEKEPGSKRTIATRMVNSGDDP